MSKILFITLHRKDRSPGQRFRFEQYLEYLGANGFEYYQSVLLNQKDDRIFYSKGHLLQKIFILVKCFFIRLKDIFRAKRYDIIFIYRDAYFFGGIFFEKLLKLSNAKIIMDFDDSIWINDVSDANKNFAWLKGSNKTPKIIRLSDLVIVGNEYLAGYAKKYNDNVLIIPTTIDTKEYQPLKIKKEKYPVCIGWSGSITTIKHFEFALPFLKELKKLYGDKIHIKVIGDGNYRNKDLDIIGQPWKKETEINDLLDIDIGIMPLPDDEWAKGKCGLKGLQYMALEIPTIMSPVGVNTDIIEQGKNGFLAKEHTEWIACLSKLIDNVELRKQIGLEARKTVEEKYSCNSQKDLYLKTFKNLVK